MLETIREYARERLEDASQRADCERRHARYFVERLDQAYGERLGPRRAEVLAWYGAEIDNLRAMLDGLTRDAPAEAARATHELFRFWKFLNAHLEAAQRLESLLELEQLPDDLRAETLSSLAEVHERVGNLDAAWAAADEALRLSAPMHACVISLEILASREVLQGRVEEGLRLAQQATDEANVMGQTAIAALSDLAMLLVTAGRREEARAALMQTIADARTSDLPMTEHRYLGRLGFVDVLDADYESARRALISAVGYVRSVVLPDDTFALQLPGFAYLGLGDRRAARATFGELLEVSSEAVKTVTPELGVGAWRHRAFCRRGRHPRGCSVVRSGHEAAGRSRGPADVDVAAEEEDPGPFRATADRRARR